MNGTDRLFEAAARLDRAGIVVTRDRAGRGAGLDRRPQGFRYEDEGIVPFVANSPR